MKSADLQKRAFCFKYSRNEIKAVVFFALSLEGVEMNARPIQYST